jgi:hypothetical protein
MGYRLTCNIILIWTYHVFDKLKVIIMGNGYDALPSDVIETFLLAPSAPSVQFKRAVTLRRTNLYDIVQNSNERVAILVPRRQVYPLHHLTQEEYLPLNHLEFVTLVSHPPDGYQGRQEGVLLQPGGVWSKRTCVLLGSL